MKDLTKALTTVALSRAASQIAYRARPAWLQTPAPAWRRTAHAAEPAADPKVLSMEVELGGMAVELKAKGLRGIVTWLSLGAFGLAMAQELAKPRQFRTWHGRVAGVIPYDFRKPTARRILNAIWAPDNPRLFTDTAFGVGWTINLAQLPRALAGGSRRPRPGAPGYVAPRVAAESAYKD